MSIEVVHEDINELKKWGLGLEKIIESCIFCKGKTRYWSKEVNKPICKACANDHSLHEIRKEKK